ncbi:T9SS type A sorting domain-containing protein [Tamlana fucoidanivorans]|uniref:T9SS type A sorting domain-containing protein n=1 Tax=Allotamlana fucoidanivorans TaxID=2583814 RepID=A0A5C4SNK5_9FLAO|nr:T9SS type A sorting domain-containing protein [Tamlana fucoidanivorans]TNJ44894.1 T9SS type A sorting domain-containing protein [Tamlana fucoidanivorans]
MKITTYIVALWVAIVPVNLISQNIGEKVLLPIEVLGAEGTIEEINLTLSQEQANQAKYIWLQINNLGYQNKASVKINNEDWYDLNHDSCRIQSPEKERGGMAHGGHSTIRLSIPAVGIISGLNTIKFRFNKSDAISNGFRIVQLNLFDVGGAKILDDSFFEEDDPMLWEGPYTDASNIQAGKDLWYYAELKSNYLDPGVEGFWYGYKLPGQGSIKAKCASCHTQDGRDLEIFSYSNKSIIERAKFHMLTEEEGKQIASYIRSLSAEHDNVNRYGRPWNPPYQPGPDLANKPIEQWAAGAGLDAVLEADKDMLDHMFPNGVTQETVYDRFDSDKMVDRTLLPLAIQFPDWKHWLPMIHPMDAYSKDNFWEDPVAHGGRYNIYPKKGYRDFRNYLEAVPPANRTPNDLMQKNRDFWYHYRFFLAVKSNGDSSLSEHWREPLSLATSKLGEGIPREFAATSLARLMAVQYFELMNEFNLQDKAHWFAKPEDQPATRQWFGENYQVFEVPPHFQACVSESELPINDGYNIVGNCLFFHGQSEATGAYESTNWYHLQLIVNGGNGMVSHNSPMDYNYHPDFIMKASSTSGIYEPLRYYHSMNAMYQFRSWSGATTPNNGKGFRIRVQGPWHIIGRTDSNQLNNFAPSVWPTFLDRIEEGMSKWVLNAQLRQFLTEVRKPENNLENWNRLPNGGSNELDYESKKTEDLQDMTYFVGLDYHADKFYYLFPEFAKLGVDCQILEEMIDWCSEAWPNIDWERFRSTGQLQLDFITNQSEDCSLNATKIIAQTANEGDFPVFEWWIDESKVINNSSELDITEVRPGAKIKCRVTSSKSCISNSWIEKEMVLASKDYSISVSKNDAEWQPLKNAIACIGDELNLKITPELQNPIFWLDASDVRNDGTKPEEGELIAVWKNKSASGYSMPYQSNYNLRPTYSNNGMNGKPAIMFGMNDSDGLPLFLTNNDDVLDGDWSMVVTGKYYVTSHGDWNALLGNEDENTGFAFYIDRRGNGGRIRTKINGSQEHGRVYEDGSAFATIISKQGGKIKVYINGRLEEEVEATSSAITNLRTFYLGQRDGGNAGGSWYHRGPISEVLFYDYVLSNKQRHYLEGYVMHKWDLVQEMPLDHVYKENSPLYLNLNTPKGEELVFDLKNQEHRVVISDASDFGEYAFKRPSCSDINAVFNVKDMEQLNDDVIKYSVNNKKFKIGASTLIKEGSFLELDVNYEINGGYQWETPTGELLQLNTSPAPILISLGNNADIWKLHLKQNTEVCISDDIVYEFTILVEDLPHGERDDDNDGVKNDLDKCPETLPGTIVDARGCLMINTNNFTVESIGESCVGKNNGRIAINAMQPLSYALSLNNSEPQDFNEPQSHVVEGLNPGVYSVCISVAEEPSYQQCFNVVVDAAEEITGKSVTIKNGSVVTQSVEITSGTAPYTIAINGEALLTTYSSTFEIDVDHGDEVAITSQLDCEGSILNTADLTSYFSVYPNPTQDVLNIVIPNIDLKEVKVDVFNALQQKVASGIYKVYSNGIRVSFKDVPTGIYFVRLDLRKPINLKVIKQ